MKFIPFKSVLHYMMPDDFPRPDYPNPCRIDVMDLHVAARLRRRRLQLQLEPQLVDVAIGEPSGTVERVERGDKRLGASQLYTLATALGVGVSYFFADDIDGDARDVAELPATDQKALSEAKRFARAVARIPSPQIKHMIGDLLKSLVTNKGIPAIVPPPDDTAGEETVTAGSAPKGPASSGPGPCEKAPCERASDRASPEHLRPSGTTRPEHKRAP